MKEGMALEGFIRQDGTVKPLEKYDDTELREKIQTNTDDIDNLKSRVTAVEGGTHISADGEITPGNLVEFSENNTLKDTGKKKTDFAPATGSTAYAAKVHSHIIAKDDSAAEFEDSTVIGTMLDDGIFQVWYEPNTNNPAMGYILLVRYYRRRPSAIVQTYKNYVEQTLISRDGIMRRFRAFNDTEHTDPYAEWTSWENLIPDAGAVYAALESKADVSALAGKMDAREFDSVPTKNSTKLLTSGTVYNALPKTIRIYLHNSEFHFENVNYLTQIIQGLVATYDDREEDKDVDLSNAIKVSFLDPYNVVFTAWGSLRITVSGTGTRTIGIYIYVDGYVFTSSATESSGTITVSTNALSVAENTFIADALDDESGS